MLAGREEKKQSECFDVLLGKKRQDILDSSESIFQFKRTGHRCSMISMVKVSLLEEALLSQGFGFRSFGIEVL